MSLITSFDYRAAYGQARLLDRQKALKWDTPDDSRTGLDGSDFLDCLEWGRLPAFQASRMAFEGLIWPTGTPAVGCSYA
jgi:hypothetical protein